MPVSLSVKWVPHESGISHGTLLVPITEASAAAVTGTLEGGPFAGPEPIIGGQVYETFNGGYTCGLAEGKKKAKPVKTGTFTGSTTMPPCQCRMPSVWVIFRILRKASRSP